MRRNIAYSAVISFSLVFAACSSKEVREGDLGEDELPVAEAGTDAVPLDGSEVTPTDPLATSDLNGAPDMMSGALAEGGSGQFQDYTVNSGDTLMKIAFEVYGDLYQWRRIHEMNRDKVADPNRLVRGTVLKVEQPASPVQIDRNGEQYLIKAGDTLGSISGEVYGTRSKWKKLWENNRQLIKDPNKIFAGFTLYYTPEGDRPTLGGAPDGERNPSSVAPAANSAPAAVNGTSPPAQ